MKFIAFILPVLLAGAVSCTPKTGSKMSSMEAKPGLSPFLGAWDYTVPGTPLGDVKGKLVLKMEDGKLKGYVESDGSVSLIEELKLEDKTLTGNIFYSGTLVKMEGLFDGDTYTGNLVADGAGTFKIMASRVAK